MSEEVQNPYSMVNMKQRKLQVGRGNAMNKVDGERKRKEKKSKMKEFEKVYSRKKKRRTKKKKRKKDNGNQKT